MNVDRRKTSPTMSGPPYTQTGICGNGGRRIKNWSSIRSQGKLTGCKRSALRHFMTISHVTCRFRWVFCQLDTLRHCYPASLRDALLELPESLDETYKRTLLRIEKARREYAVRLFQCLTVSSRPLLVEEVADLLAIRFDSQSRAIYHAD